MYYVYVEQSEEPVDMTKCLTYLMVIPIHVLMS